MSPSRRRLALLVVLLAAIPATTGLPARSDGNAEGPWSDLDRVAQEAVAAGKVPGVVFLVGEGDRVVTVRAYGRRAVRPAELPMTADTVFDLASLTKVISTTSAIMQLVGAGRVRLTDPVYRYWPEWKENGKDKVLVRHLLTHTSGLAAFINFQRKYADPMGPAVQDQTTRVMTEIAGLPLIQEPGTKFVYSDLGFITLGEIVRRVSGQPLDVFVRERIFAPLRMRETGYNPDERLRPRCAPTTEYRGVFRQGQVHDPNAAVLGGVAGHAGLFSTAHDLSRFVRSLLAGLRGSGPTGPLSPAVIRLMTSPQTPAGLPVRGLGWDLDSPYSHVRGDLMPTGSFGHTGFTGTFLWIDPATGRYLIGLSNRVHPDEGGSPLDLWARAANITQSVLSRRSRP